jgi:hypothetical protein
MLQGRNGLITALAMLVVFVVPSGCAPSPPRTATAPIADAPGATSAEATPVDRTLTLPSGARRNPDGTMSFISIDPGVRGFEFNAPGAEGVYTRLRLRDAQHVYEYASE